MKRAEKIALLTKVLQEGTNDANRQRLQKVTENGAQSLIIIDDLDFEPGQSMTDSDPVHFQDRGKEHRMTLGEAQYYAHRYMIRTLFILPVKREAR